MIIFDSNVHKNLRKLFLEASEIADSKTIGHRAHADINLCQLSVANIIFSLFYSVVMLLQRKRISQFTYRGIGLGKYVAASYIRQTRDYQLAFDCWLNILQFIKCIAFSLAAIDNSKKLFKFCSVSNVIVHDKGYTPFGEFLSEALNHNLFPIEVVAGHKDNMLMIRKNTKFNRDEHPSSVSKDNFFYFASRLNDRELTEGRREILDSYKSGQWYSEVGTQKSAELKPRARQLIKKNYRRHIVIFPHIFYDSTFFYGVDIFQNYYDWFVNLVQFAAEKDSTQWIIKSHPANIVKDSRDGIVSINEEAHVKKILGKVPEHFTFIAADSEISTPDLISQADALCTVRGTVGLEGALAGKAVFTAGTGRYDGLGFTYDARSSSEYFSQLRRFVDQGELPFTIDVKLAETYAFLLFKKRPFNLQGMTWEYPKFNNYTLMTEIKDKAKFLNDITRLRQWLNSEQSEYLN